jgi:hypothetical protein
MGRRPAVAVAAVTPGRRYGTGTGSNERHPSPADIDGLEGLGQGLEPGGELPKYSFGPAQQDGGDSCAEKVRKHHGERRVRVEEQPFTRGQACGRLWRMMLTAGEHVPAGRPPGMETKCLVKQHLPSSKKGGDCSQGQPPAWNECYGCHNERGQRHRRFPRRERTSAEDVGTCRDQTDRPGDQEGTHRR